ncbi:MAG: preprotein translocase subunit SecG [Helicobacteraceae bacterium]|jgi:preprotein translocase subunit SecG|nr:preprotein translocase subunit SecG [Helicobacteraceae bacterium]
MITPLLFVQFGLAILIVIVVLLQKSSSIGLGAYSGSNESFFGSKGPNAFLAKTTAVLGVLFAVNTIALTYLYYADRNASVVDSAIAQEGDGVPPVPALPEVPQE